MSGAGTASHAIGSTPGVDAEILAGPALQVLGLHDAGLDREHENVLAGGRRNLPQLAIANAPHCGESCFLSATDRTAFALAEWRLIRARSLHNRAGYSTTCNCSDSVENAHASIRRRAGLAFHPAQTS